jgi:hypothetical protein
MLKGFRKQMVQRLFGGHKLLPATIQPGMRAIFVIFLILAFLAVVVAGLICARSVHASYTTGRRATGGGGGGVRREAMYDAQEMELPTEPVNSLHEEIALCGVYQPDDLMALIMGAVTPDISCSNTQRSDYEIQKVAEHHAQIMKHNPQAHLDPKNALDVFEVVAARAQQNPNFVQVVLKIPPSKMPPDHVWQTENINSICRWWVMQYLSLVRSEFIHDVVRCQERAPQP